VSAEITENDFICKHISNIFAISRGAALSFDTSDDTIPVGMAAVPYIHFCSQFSAVTTD
jgi:hypothetical protein